MTMNKMHILLSATSMTPLERAAGRFMRAPDHTSGDGGDGNDGGGAPSAEPEATGAEINDDIEDLGNSDGGLPSGSVEDDTDGGGTPPVEGATAPKSAEERLAALEAASAAKDRDLEYWMGRANGTIDENGNPIGQQPPQDGAIPADDTDRPDPAKYKYGETDTAFIADLAAYEGRKAFQEEAAKAEVRRQIDEVESTYKTRVGEATERYPDFQTLVVEGANPDPATGRPRWACSPAMSLGIKTSEYGPDIAHFLASNPDESFRIAGLHPIEQAKEFGKLEYRMELEHGKTGDSTQRRVSNAPTPAPRARGGGGGRGEVDPATDNFAAFEARADAHFKQASSKRR